MTDKLKVVLFRSRNKDNKHIEGFKERRRSFVSTKTPKELMDSFDAFVEKGVPGEVSRFYHSVNARDNSKIRKALIHYLIDHEDFDVTKLPGKTASIASLTENAAEKRWLFDFDEEKHLIGDFLNDVRQEVPFGVDIIPHQTPNGYAVIVGRGFDTRELLKRWSKVDLKRDDMLCVDWKTKKLEFTVGIDELEAELNEFGLD